MGLSQQGRTSIIVMFLGSAALIGLGLYIGFRPLLPDSQQRSPESSDQESTESSTDEGASQTTYSYGETGDGVNDFGACDADAETYCSDVGESIEASYKLDLVNCLNEHDSELSNDCQASLDRRVALSAAVNESCAVERSTLCAGVFPEPGSEPGNDCLWENESELSEECLVALTAQNCAKPVNQADHCE